MSKIENDEQRKIRNAHFIRAFEYVASVLELGQGELAERIGSKSSYISNFKKGLRPVPPETITGLINISASKPGLQIFSEYLYGNSDIMLLANVSDEEMAAAKSRSGNPDYEAIHKRDKEAHAYNKSRTVQMIYRWPFSAIWSKNHKSPKAWPLMTIHAHTSRPGQTPSSASSQSKSQRMKFCTQN